MMKIKIVMLLTIGMLLSVASYAQKVKATSGGAAEIDCTGMKGVSTTSKGFTNTSTLTKSEKKSNEYTSEDANKQIYYKFEVAANDTGNGEMLWTDALARCRALGAGWRLPTHRELVLILVLNPELKKAGNSPLDLNFGYWSATVAGSYYGFEGYWIDTDAWAVGKVIGPTGKDRTIKENETDPDNPPNKVRCIRELP